MRWKGKATEWVMGRRVGIGRCVAAAVCGVVMVRVIAGCGGGASGTGGLAGDLNPGSKIADISEDTREAVCNRIVQVATTAAKSDTRFAAAAVINELMQKYLLTEWDESSATGTTRPTEAFLNLTRQEFETECRALFAQAVARQEQEAECFDISRPAPAANWEATPMDAEMFGFKGRCDLKDELFTRSDVTVAEYGGCLSAWVSSQFFSPKAFVRCDALYDLIKDPSSNVDAFGGIERSPDAPQNRRFRKLCGRVVEKTAPFGEFSSAPLVCVVGGTQPERYVLFFGSADIGTAEPETNSIDQ